MFRRLLSVVLPLLILAAALWGARMIMESKPAARSRPEPVRQVTVDAIRVKTTRYPVIIRSQGTVQPTFTRALVPEVAGTVVSVSPAFVVGGRFEAGEVLLEIDRKDYEIALTQAQASLAQASAQLQEQQALADRARDEWQSMGRRGQPSPLTLREPQLAAARANQDAAEAQLRRAELDLQRTRIVADHEGLVGAREVDPGQFVSRGALVGKIHRIDTADIRLPLSQSQLTFLDRQGNASVELSALVAGQRLQWQGRLIRIEGLDAVTQQLNVVAQVQNPYPKSPSASRQPLRFGQFVEARVAGEVLEDAIVIPKGAVRLERDVLLVNAQNRIERRAVTVIWTDDEQAVLSAGLSAGDVLVVTPLDTVANGTPVKAIIAGETPPETPGSGTAGASVEQAVSRGARHAENPVHDAGLNRPSAN